MKKIALFSLLSFLTFSSQAITAYFTVDTTQVCVGGTVHVTNLSSTGSNITYKWSIVNAYPSTWNLKNIPQGITFYGGTNSNQIKLVVSDTVLNTTATYSLFVNTWPLPNITSTAPYNLIMGCNNSPIDLIVKTNDLNDYYNWTDGNGMPLGTGDSLHVINPGAYNLKIINSFGCFAEQSYYIQSHPGANLRARFLETKKTIGDTAMVCENFNGDTLYDLNFWSLNSYSYYNFYWEDSSSAYSRMVSKEKMYTITAIDPWGCVDKDSVYLLIQPKPLAVLSSSATSLCGNSSVTLSFNSGPGYKYEWSIYQGLYAAGQSLVVSDPGSYWGFVTDSLGCLAKSNIISLEFHPNPDTAVDKINCDLIMVNLNAGDKYQWYKNNQSVSGATNAYYSASSAGFYHVDVENSYGCKLSSPNRWLYCSMVEVDELGEESASIFPNPFTDHFNIEFKDQSEHLVSLYDLLGNKLIERQGREVMDITRDNLSPGIYLLVIDQGRPQKIVAK